LRQEKSEKCTFTDWRFCGIFSRNIC